MKLTIDTRVEVAYLSLRDNDEQVKVATTLPVKPPGAVRMDDRINLDFDVEGRLVGIEFLVPGGQLLPSVIERAQPRRT